MSSQSSNASKQSSSSSQVVLTPSDWDTSAIKFTKPYVTKSGSKSISIISKQTNRSLTISTPWMMTWGCSDFTDANGDSDGKFNISLNFPTEGDRTEQTDLFLQKLKDFENQILDDAVKMSETWWGEPMSREICKHTFFPVLKYSKNKDTNKIDYTRAPSFRAKVPYYDGVWKVEIYNTRGNLIFPNDSNPDETPSTIITKFSNISCVLQSTGIWIGGKGWGVTWKLVQCAVKPKEVVSITGRCLISLPVEEPVAQQQQTQPSEPVEITPFVAPVVIASTKLPAIEPVTPTAPPTPVVASTEAEDTDDEDNAKFVEKIEEPVAPIPAPAPAPVRKVIKKTIAPEPEQPVSIAVEAPTDVVPKKKIVKKVVSAAK